MPAFSVLMSVAYSWVRSAAIGRTHRATVKSGMGTGVAIGNRPTWTSPPCSKCRAPFHRPLGIGIVGPSGVPSYDGFFSEASCTTWAKSSSNGGCTCR